VLDDVREPIPVGVGFACGARLERLDRALDRAEATEILRAR
jgi:hypothetical protein